jgi:hypothetical protein
MRLLRAVRAQRVCVPAVSVKGDAAGLELRIEFDGATGAQQPVEFARVDLTGAIGVPRREQRVARLL